MSCTDLRVETRGPATWITLDRPEAMNAVRPRTHEELTDALLEADADRATRSSRAWCRTRSFIWP